MDKRILDAEGNELSEEDVDLEAGYLRPDLVVTQHHDAVEEVPEEGHLEYETFYFTDGTSYTVTGTDDPHLGESGYVNLDGEEPKTVFGADQKWVVDVPQVDARDAWDETESVYRYVPYTEDELAEIAAERAEAGRLASVEEQLTDMQMALVEIYESML